MFFVRVSYTKRVLVLLSLFLPFLPGSGCTQMVVDFRRSKHANHFLVGRCIKTASPLIGPQQQPNSGVKACSGCAYCCWILPFQGKCYYGQLPTCPMEWWFNKHLTLPKTNSSHQKIGHPKRKQQSYSNHPFSGAMLVSGRVCCLFNTGGRWSHLIHLWLE